MDVKPGVLIEGLHPWLNYAAQVFDYAHQLAGYGEATITGGREPAPGRARDTLHPWGGALDFRLWAVPVASRLAFRDLLRYWLGPAFDVVLESNHYHIELSPAALAYLRDAAGVEQV